MRVVALHRHDALDLALRVEDHLRLDRLEVDRAALLRAPAASTLKSAYSVSMCGTSSPGAGGSASRLVEYRRHLRVGEPRMRVDHAG